MKKEIADLFRSLPPPNTSVIPKSLPIPFFGRYDLARVATLSLNPSHQEFFDKKNSWRSGTSLRFESLHSLSVSAPQYLTNLEIQRAFDRCYGYFGVGGVPYRWFKPLEKLLAPLGFSYGGGSMTHLDLSPWATLPAWGKLSKSQQSILQLDGATFLRWILDYSLIAVLIVNGRSAFEGVLTTLQIPKMAVKILDVPGSSWKIYQSKFTATNGKYVKILGWNYPVIRRHPPQQLSHFLGAQMTTSATCGSNCCQDET